MNTVRRDLTKKNIAMSAPTIPQKKVENGSRVVVEVKLDGYPEATHMGFCVGYSICSRFEAQLSEKLVGKKIDDSIVVQCVHSNEWDKVSFTEDDFYTRTPAQRGDMVLLEIEEGMAAVRITDFDDRAYTGEFIKANIRVKVLEIN